MNVLITSASNKVWLIQAFRKALINNGGGNVYAADIVAEKVALYFADDFFILPKSDNEIFVSELLKSCLNENIDLIIPTRDAELKILSENKQLFSAYNIKVMVADPESIMICQDKYSFYQFCIKNNHRTIKTNIDSENVDFEYPVFVKPKVGSGGVNTFIAKSEKKLKQFLLLYDETRFVMQPLIKESEYTIDLFSDFEGNVISVVVRKRINIQYGESIVGKIECNRTIVEQTTKIARNLKLVGHNTIQCFYNKEQNQVTFIEVNPRYGGGAALGFSGGNSTPEYLIQLMQNKLLKTNDFSNIKANELWMFKYTAQVFLTKKTDGFISAVTEKKIFCIDIDGTICTEMCQYVDAQPVKSVIKKINQLYNNGHTIILLTSRGYSSGFDWMPLLEEQMEKWGVLYHEIRQGKPYADYYIDNKAINIFDWVG